jgi:hypothetical protein
MSSKSSDRQKKQKEIDIENIHNSLAKFKFSGAFPRISDMLEEVRKIKSSVETLYIER